MRFDNGHTHVVHLMQGGRLRPDPKETKTQPRGGLMRWTFAAGDRDELGTPSWPSPRPEPNAAPGSGSYVTTRSRGEPLDHLGPEATDLSVDALATTVRRHSKRLHGLLRDQRVVAGLGRMLTNEVLYEAELSPFVNASKLSDDDVARLHSSIASVVASALAHERTLDDIGKSVDRPSKVHNRAGEPCVDCGDTIRTIDYRAYTVYSAPPDRPVADCWPTTAPASSSSEPQVASAVDDGLPRYSATAS
ncbi:MAG: hypothetical protein R2710_02755 [Acidimicrobiales bacterium]